MALTTHHFTGITAIVLTVVSLTTAIGCSNCLDQDIDTVRYGCLSDCSQSFNPHSIEADACLKSCNDFVFDRKCCSSDSCDSDSKLCLAPLPSYNFSTSIDQLGARSVADLGVRTLAARRKNDETKKMLEPRFDAAGICCTAVQKVLDTAAKDVEPILKGEYPQNVQLAGVTLFAFGIAGSVACNFAFGFKCIFEAMKNTTGIAGV